MTAPNLRLVQQRGERAAEKPTRKTSSRKKPEAAETAERASNIDASAAASASALPVASKAADPRKRRKTELCAREVMTTPARSCLPTDSLNDAAKVLWEHNLGALVVVNDDLEPVSMITDRDICFAAYTQGVALWSSHVATAMSPKAVVCRDSDSLTQVRRTMSEAKIRRVPVVDDAGKLVGIVGMADLCGTGPATKAAATPAELAQLLNAWVSPSA